jgi:beta-glucosidase
MVRVVEPGTVRLFVGRSCADPVLTAEVELTGPVHEVSVADRRVVRVQVTPV